MKRWLALAVGIAIASLALYLLVAPGDPAPPDVEEIDEASRAALERVLREAEESEPTR